MSDVPRRVRLDEPIEIALDGPVDPLSLGTGAVLVRDEDGRELTARVEARGGVVRVALLVDARLHDAPPGRVLVELLGAPSPRAVRTRDGRALGRSTEVEVVVEPLLEPRAARLVEVDGHALPFGGPLDVGDELVLVFEGALDPATVDAAGSPVFRRRGGLVLAVEEALVDWRLLGDRFEVSIRLAGSARDLVLDLGRGGFRDLLGDVPRPAVELALRRRRGRRRRSARFVERTPAIA